MTEKLYSVELKGTFIALAADGDKARQQVKALLYPSNPHTVWDAHAEDLTTIPSWWIHWKGPFDQISHKVVTDPDERYNDLDTFVNQGRAPLLNEWFIWKKNSWYGPPPKVYQDAFEILKEIKSYEHLLFLHGDGRSQSAWLFQGRRDYDLVCLEFSDHPDLVIRADRDRSENYGRFCSRVIAELGKSTCQTDIDLPDFHD